MELKINSSQEQAAKAAEASAKVTGILPFKVLALNPSADWIVKNFNPNYDKTPDYNATITEEGHSKMRLDFYLESHPKVQDGENTVEKQIRLRHSIWIENKVRTTQSGDTFRIATSGAVHTAGTIEGYAGAEWLGQDYRDLFVGEDELTDFIRAYACLKQDDLYRFSDPEAIAKGNIKELVAVIKQIQAVDNEVYLLVGINEKGYYEVYRKRYFTPATGTPKRVENFINKSEYNEFKKAVTYSFLPVLVKEDAPVKEAVKEAAEEAKQEEGTPDW